MTLTPLQAAVASVVAATAGKRFSRVSELMLKDGMEKVFREAGLLFRREERLSDADIADFWFHGVGIAVEVKVKGSLESHLRQMRRYASHATVAGVLLVATRPFQLPETLCGKPVACLNFGSKCL